MEEAPVTAATGALGPVVAKLRSLLRRRGERAYQLRRPTRKDVKLIRSKLKSIHSILWVTWEREDVDAEGKELRMEAWRLADDMNDAIDDFIFTMKRSSDGKRFMEDKTQPRPFEDLKKRADDVSERCRKKWKMETAHTKVWSLFSRTKSTVDSGPAKWPARVVDPYVRKAISELVDLEEPRNKIIEHLVGEEESTPHLKMASILGAAGTGKTTLARLVYEAIQDKFQARAFVSITSCHNMKEVLTSILQQVAVDTTAVLLDGTQAATKNQHLIAIISSFLKDKRYLVIIDDIWHCGEWETIKESLPENYLGSRIVTTSRANAITDKWRDDFDALVHKIRQGSSNKMIYKMCRDMPLAVACMFSALAKERERQEQQGLCVETHDVQDRIEEQVKRNGIQNTPGFEPLVESLELGYKDLPHHMLKTCLLYCSIYPEDHCFRRDDLVRRWIAEGFVCKEEVAKDYFEELVSRGLFEFQNDDAKLHPMMRNYLRWKLREDNFITCTSDGVPSSPVGRLCIDYWPASSDTLSGIDDWHHIRSLVVFKDAESVPYQHFENLRVLDVQCNPVLENQRLKDMCGLLRLRLLRLCGDGISKIPADIGRLKYLETLELIKTKITRLPAEMGNLQHILETLIIRRSNIREQAWEIIGTLKKLKTLEVSWNELSGIPRDIGELQQLKNLDTRNSSITELPKEIGKLQHLETLDLTRVTGITELPHEIGKLHHLKTLKLTSTGITELPREIGNLQRLQTLDLSFTGITELPREIWNLQHMQTLDLYNVKAVTKLPRDIGRLQHLERLNLGGTNVKKMPREIGRLKKLKDLDADIGTQPFEAGQLPKLNGLPKCVHKAWKNSDLVSSLAGEILSFEKAIYLIGDGGLIVGTKHMHIPQWIKEHFNNIHSLDIRICKLEEQDLKVLREMPYLCDLTLRFEAAPRKKIVINSGGFAKLEDLTIDSRVPRVTFLEGAMPKLKSLSFEFQFYGGSPNKDPMGIKNLKSLRYVYFDCNKWYQVDSPCISDTIGVTRKEAEEHKNRITLRVRQRQGDFSSEDDGSHTAQSSEDRSEACSSSGAERIEEDEFSPGNSITQSSEDCSEACSSGGAEEIEETSEDGREVCSSSGVEKIEENQD